MYSYLGFIYCVLCFVLSFTSAQDRDIPCWDDSGNPQRCIPDFSNAAYGLPMEATNTCGIDSVSQYCLQTGVTGVTKSCQACDGRLPMFAHPASHLTDFNKVSNFTWWQSDTMQHDIQYPNTVNLTLNFEKAFDITYVRILFHSSRPDSFAIYKRTSEDAEWTPFQFYSSQCESTYKQPRNQPVRRGDEAKAICTDGHSDISPLTGGVVAFSTLVNRPSAYDFDNSPQLQDWVTATDIRIVLSRLNTFGDEVFRDPQVLKSYFYAISDIAVGATCKCNGHANKCIPDRIGKLSCECQHNTTGRDCEKCLPLYNDRPWARATADNANPCLLCDCNGLSEECEFDPDLYTKTGRGGRCVNCRHNTGGENCDQCLAEHYLKRPEKICTPCFCNKIGSQSLQCDKSGQCPCKPGVAGQFCDRCLPNFYDFTMYGCKACGCDSAGSSDRNAICNPAEGSCSCKENVEGRTCDTCKAGFFGLRESNPYGCLACFCYGHSDDCHASAGFYSRDISTAFDAGDDRWRAVNRGNQDIKTQYNPIIKNLGVSARGRETVYFSAPDRFLGDQRFSYDQHLTFTLRVGEDGARASIEDVLIQGGNGQKISAPIFAQRNPMPGVQAQKYKFRLHNHADYRWSPQIKADDFISVLSNVTAIKIRGTYTEDGVGFLHEFTLETARRGLNGGDEAKWIEQCRCHQTTQR